LSSLREYAPAAEAARPLSEVELLDSLDRALAPWKPGTPFWIFAYGSLMWNPSFKSDAHHVAMVRGYHRSFRLWSRLNRGSPENPGLVLTLERGGSCRGLVYRIDPAIVRAEIHGIWKREMTYGSYLPKWLRCTLGGETVNALAFTVNRACSGYAGAIPLEVMVDCLASARGRFGPAHDYLFKTTETLRTHGIHDERVEHLAHLVKARISAKPGRE
jgi:glutathione-specific gamma-glutamylcyclotransferase